MTLQQWLELPEWIDVRLVRYTIRVKGRRTRHVVVATTLLDQRLWPDAKLAELYGRRWEIETCFDHLKTTMRMNVLKCQSVEGVMKELAIYLLVYNLVRLTMLRYARECGVCIARVSFVDTLRWLCCRMLGLSGAAMLLINPYSKDEISDAIARALDMPRAERIRRWRAMMDVIEKEDVVWWRKAFVESLLAAGEDRNEAEAAELLG